MSMQVNQIKKDLLCKRCFDKKLKQLVAIQSGMHRFDVPGTLWTGVSLGRN
jgi:hypothetical protein